MDKATKVGAVALLLAAIAGTLLITHEYKTSLSSLRLAYTSSVTTRDILDTSSRAIAALSDAELRVPEYVLTGETIYSEAYSADLRVWQDESGSLGLVGRHDRSAESAQDLLKAGGRAIDELAATVQVFERNGSAASLDRIRKGSASVYLDQARSAASKIQQNDGADLTRQELALIDTSERMLRRLTAASGCLLVIVFSTAVILFTHRSPIYRR
jgi:CHASE3 domain sensor protein